MTGEIQFPGGAKYGPQVWVHSLGKDLQIPRIDLEIKRKSCYNPQVPTETNVTTSEATSRTSDFPMG